MNADDADAEDWSICLNRGATFYRPAAAERGFSGIHRALCSSCSNALWEQHQREQRNGLAERALQLLAERAPPLKDARQLLALARRRGGGCGIAGGSAS